MISNLSHFPPGFRWGVAAAAYQIEGAPFADGRGPSVWDLFSETPGAVRDGASGARACDHYARYAEDFALLAQLGIPHYRLSVAWPRIFPAPHSSVNMPGLDHYDRLVDAALKFGIQPSVTCFHWDMPSSLQDRGGWLERVTAHAFADYCGVLAGRLGDRVLTWYTLNESAVVLKFGHELGTHAPGLRLDTGASHQVAHHMLLAHGLGAQAIRAASPRKCRVGIVENLYSFEPALPIEEDIEAARAEFRRRNAWLMEPLFFGHYPAAQWEALGENAPTVLADDLRVISQPMDFIGINHYSAMGLVSAEHGVRRHEKWYPRTDFGWPVSAESLYWTLRFCRESYHPPAIEVTENGCCYPDQRGQDGIVQDTARIAMLNGAISSVARALGEGVPVEAYYLWSLMDNFEWAEGYSKRFGIIHVDYETMARTPKLSAHWYSRLIREHAQLQDGRSTTE